jgi:hypothetical protein
MGRAGARNAALTLGVAAYRVRGGGCDECDVRTRELADFHKPATELDCKRRSYRRVSEVPANIILTVVAATASKTCFDISLGMKRMHRFEPLAEATRRYSHLDGVRKLPSKGFVA